MNVKNGNEARPLISIVVCCYNRADFLPTTMESLFNQNYSPVEIVVLDDGSRDDTPEIMAAYGGKIRYFRQDNQGISVARTNACRLALGKYIAFVDDDDLMPPDRINILYSALMRFPDAVFAVGDFAVIDDNNNLTGHRWLPENKTNKETMLINDGYEAVLWPKVPATVHTTLFRKSDGEKIGWFDIQYSHISEDKDFFARLGKLGPIVYVPEVVSLYRRGHQSLTKNVMRAACGKCIFLSNHLRHMGPHNKSLYRRLQSRILASLKEIALYKSGGVAFSEGFTKELVSQSLELLTFGDRLEYVKYTALKLPIKKIIRGKS